MASDIGIKVDNRYDVQGELGRGGMGVVYKAYDHKMERLVAIKVMTSHVAGRDEYYERFLREAKSVARMQHPNIVVVYDHGSHAGSPYMAMEYVEGTPLDKLIHSKVNLSLLLKVDYVIQVCRALHYAHQLGIVHRDVKPGNVMVLEGGQRVKLLDFGIARAGGASMLSKSGLAMGTTFYMSPEQTRGQKNLDGRSDIFSAGVVLYELVTGTIPWSGEGDYEIMTKIINDPFPPLSNRLRNYPRELDQILGRALAKHADRRYQTAEEMALELCELETPLKEQVLEDALAQFEQGDLYRANELVSQILRIDTRHRKAIELRAQLQQLSELQQKSEKVRQLRTTAEEAVGQKRYQDALAAVEQAIAIRSTDPELLQYRGLIKQELKRKEEVRKKLELARRAQEINDLNSAAELVDKALEVDPTDTHARMMKSALQQEKTRQQMQELAEEASRAITGHAFSQAKELIRQLEALGPTFAPLTSLKKALLETEAEEKRRVEMEELIAEIRQVLKASDVKNSLALTQQALAKFPAEPRLSRLRAQAEALRDTTERERTIQEQLAAVNRFVERGEINHALGMAESALRQFSDDRRLQTVVTKLREAAERESQSQVLNEVLSRAHEAMQVQDYQRVVKLLGPARADFPASEEVAQLLQNAQEAIAQNIANKIAENTRKREIAEALERKLASETDPDAQVGSAEEALRTLPGNELVERALRRVRDLQQNISTAAQRAESLERARNYQDAIREWERVRELYPQHPQAQAHLEWLKEILEPAHKPAVTAPVHTPAPELAATVIAGSAAAVKKATAPKIPPPAITKPRATRQKPVEVVPTPLPVWKRPIVVGAAACTVVLLVLFIYLLWPSAGVPILFQTDPAGASVMVAGKHCVAPCALKLKPGKHRAEAAKQGYFSAQKEFSVGSQPETVSLNLVLVAPDVGVLFLESNVEQADVFVDGELKGTTAGGRTAITLSPGTHAVLLKKQGYLDQTQPVEVRGGSGVTSYFSLTRSPVTSPPPADSYVIIRSQPGANVQIDNDEVGQVQEDGTYSRKVSGGKHRIQVTLPPNAAWNGTVTVKPGDRLSVDAVLKKPVKPPPVIVSFSASRTEIQVGQDTKLEWQVRDATQIVIEPIGEQGARGTLPIAPNETTTYRLIARGEGPDVQRSVTIKVAVPKPTISMFEASPEKLRSGQSARLVWATQNAAEVAVSPELGSVTPNGSREVRPANTTTYSLTARNAGGTVTRSVQVTVDTENPDVRSVKDVIDLYKDAYESMSIDEIKIPWPDISKDQRNALKSAFKAAKAIKLVLRCGEASISGDTAQCECSQELTYTAETGERIGPTTNPVVFRFKKKSGKWYIADVRGR